MSFLKTAKNGVAWTFMQQTSVQAINLGVQIVLARILVPSDFGLVAMIAIFVALGQSLSDSGMTTSLIRNRHNSESDYGTVFITNLLISVLIYFVVFIGSPLVAQFYDQDILKNLLRTYSLVFVIGAFSAVQLARFSKKLQFKIQFLYQLPSTVIGAITGIVLAYLDYGVWSLVWLNVAQSFSFVLFLWVFHTWRPRFVFSKSLFRHHFSFGYKLTVSGLLHTVYLNLYKIIIGKYFSPANVGYFTQADSLRLFPINQLSSVLNKVTFPLFASISDNPIKLKQAYVSAMRLVLSCSAAMMIILILIAEPLFLFVFGEKWLPSVPYFQILCIASVFLPIGTYNLNILKVKGRSDLFLKVEVIKKIIGCVALFGAVPFGISAMVWSLSITNVFFAYLNGYFSGRLIDYKVTTQIKDSFYVILLAIVPLFPVYFFNQYLESEFEMISSAKIGVTLFIYLAIYTPVVAFFNKEMLADVKKILKR